MFFDDSRRKCGSSLKLCILTEKIQTWRKLRFAIAPPPGFFPNNAFTGSDCRLRIPPRLLDGAGALISGLPNLDQN
uniref:Uncharacterized protein n=1 Tax=Cucumis melo TaxID=3656 RepID=A0A9I9D2V7_CUCME